MSLFFKTKTKAEQSRINALKATKDMIQNRINRISQNGFFSITYTIRRRFTDVGDLSSDIVPILKEQFEKDGYTVTIDDGTYFIINW